MLFSTPGTIVEIDALFSSTGRLTEEARKKLEEAELIFGVARDDGHEFIVYGLDIIKAALAGQESAVVILSVGVDQETDDLEKLVAAVRVVKGRDDYEEASNWRANHGRA
jgi:hypothetical protein